MLPAGHCWSVSQTKVWVMSQEFSDPELFADFIAEAKEHLETIEPNLLELEKTPDNLALLNDIFRHALPERRFRLFGSEPDQSAGA